MKKDVFRAVLCAAMLLIPSRVAAQSEAVMEPGQRVRVVSVDSRRVTGRVQAISDDRLLVQPRRGATVELPVASVESVQISRGYRDRTLQGALIGGLATGTVVALLMASHDGTAEYGGRAGAAQYGFIIGTVPGVLVGTVVGFLTSPERWVRGAVPGPR